MHSDSSDKICLFQFGLLRKLFKLCTGTCFRKCPQYFYYRGRVPIVHVLDKVSLLQMADIRELLSHRSRVTHVQYGELEVKQ